MQLAIQLSIQLAVLLTIQLVPYESSTALIFANFMLRMTDWFHITCITCAFHIACTFGIWYCVACTFDIWYCRVIMGCMLRLVNARCAWSMLLNYLHRLVKASQLPAPPSRCVAITCEACCGQHVARSMLHLNQLHACNLHITHYMYYILRIYFIYTHVFRITVWLRDTCSA